MGDVLMLMEFSKSFAKVLQTTKFFPHGLTLDLMERALMEKEVREIKSKFAQGFFIKLFFKDLCKWFLKCVPYLKLMFLLGPKLKIVLHQQKLKTKFTVTKT